MKSHGCDVPPFFFLFFSFGCLGLREEKQPSVRLVNVAESVCKLLFYHFLFHSKQIGVTEHIIVKTAKLKEEINQLALDINQVFFLGA